VNEWTDGETKFVLHKIEGIDEAKLGYSYSIGGAALPDTAEKITIDSILSDGPNGGSVVKLSLKYHSKGDAPPNEDELKAGKAKSDALFKVIEAYLLANAWIHLSYGQGPSDIIYWVFLCGVYGLS